MFDLIACVAMRRASLRLGSVCAMGGERATTGRPYTDKVRGGAKMSVFLSNAHIISVQISL